MDVTIIIFEQRIINLVIIFERDYLKQNVVCVGNNVTRKRCKKVKGTLHGFSVLGELRKCALQK